MVKNFGSEDSWISGVVAQQLGPLTYLVDVSGGHIWKHVDHLKELGVPHSSSAVVPEAEIDFDISSHATPADADETGDTVVTPETFSDQNETNLSTDDIATPEPDLSPLPESTPSSSGASFNPETTSTPPRRYPSHSHRPLERFDTQTW